MELQALSEFFYSSMISNTPTFVLERLYKIPLMSMKDTKMRYMCLAERLDTDLAFTLTSKSSRPLVDFLVREIGKKAKKALRKRK